MPGTIRPKLYRGSSASAQRGAILITSLVLLAVLTIIGAYVFSTGTLQEKMAASNRLITLNEHAAQSSVDAFPSEGMYVANGSLNNASNINTNIVRITIDRTTSIPKPFRPINTNAITYCVNGNGVISNQGSSSAVTNCNGIQFQNTAGQAADIRSYVQAYYASCTPTDCGPGMASSLGAGTNLGCPVFYLEGSGWIDHDGDGLPPVTASDESRIFLDEWMRWQRPTLCTF